MNQICVLGEGAWGTAVSTLLAYNGHHVKLWCQDQAVASGIKTRRCNDRYFSEHKLDERIEPITDIGAALEGVTYVFASTPVKYFRSVLISAQSYIHEAQVWVLLNKGIENETLLFPADIVDDVCDCTVKKVVLAGPSFAKELAEKRTTAVTIAATDPELAAMVQNMLANEFFRPYRTSDMIGVQFGAALKNVIALAVGMADGAGMSDNTKAFILTRGLNEMVRLVVKMGGLQETVYGLSGVGDTVMSAMGKLSRNRALGYQLGSGISMEQIKKEKPVLPESVNTVRSLHQMIKLHNLNLAICQGIYHVIYGDRTIQDVVSHLMSRPLRKESRY